MSEINMKKMIQDSIRDLDEVDECIRELYYTGMWYQLPDSISYMMMI